MARESHSSRKSLYSTLAAILVGLGGAVAGIALTADDWKSAASDAFRWSFLFVVLGAVLVGTIEIYLSRSTPGVPSKLGVITGARDLKQAYAEARSAPLPQMIRAIWVGEYGDTRPYFAAEARFLEDNPGVPLVRLVNRARLGVEASGALALLAAKHPTFQAYETSLTEFELYLCDYRTADERHQRGLFVLIDREAQPVGGVLFDTADDPALKPLASSLSDWFDRERDRCQRLALP